jgi:A/G-specific adenine glycosylase
MLVLERARSKQWTLPGGRLNEGESWDAALLREIKEETNLDVTDFKIIGNNVVTDPYQTKYCTYFVTRVSDIGKLKI